MKMVKSLGSPSRSIRSNQTDSVLTESTDEEESNFIALLQYKDAFHLLGLDEQTYPDPAEIRGAYKICRDQTIAALERCEANERLQQPARGSFLISQTNYLELKLNALDQAIYELLPEEEGDQDGDDTRQPHQQIQQTDVSSPPPLQQETRYSFEEKAEQQVRRGQKIIDTPPAQPITQPKEQIPMQEPRSNSARNISNEDDDGLDTIDIYFNSSKNNREPKASDQSDSMSIITWDASSIFSMISNSKTNEDAASESGLSDVLGKKSRDKNEIRRTNAAPKSMSRPPRGINRTLTSPRSITDFSPSIHDEGHYYKEVGHPVRRRVVTARRQLDRASPQTTSDAVRQGMMRALDEDVSQCVSLDFEGTYPQLKTKQKQSARENERRQYEVNRTMPSNQKRNGQHRNTHLDDISDNDVDSVSSKDDGAGGRYNRNRSKRETEPIDEEEDLYDSLFQSGMDGYNAVLESGMEISNQLCDALQACWIDEGSTPYGNMAADEDSATYADDLTGVYTEGESTAFNTLSSFSKCGSRGAREARIDDLNKRNVNKRRLV
mmetsp:Transcript_20818/g.29820  ORF Transcript_20818/g.29820 Transcript_20818/m.29820 type:complete len:551 (-) Transcript_20818:62-1714(-)